MASSSSHQGNQEGSAFFGIERAGERRVVSESSRLYDVFINHRGPDVKLTLATHLYNSLDQLGIRAFLDSQEKELGISFPSTIETAIRSASVHIAIFSKGYAESAWCLTELLLMLQTNAKIIPLFYQVKPSDLRHIETGVYAEAFIKYEKKGRYLEKLNEWKEALQSLSLIAGEEIESFSDWDCQKIVATVQKEVQRKTPLHVADYPVGLNNLVGDFEKRCLDELVQDFENQCGLEGGKHKVKVVAVFGMGGVGKTTLVKELFNRKRCNYSRASFLFDVREAYARRELPSLQSQLVKDLFNENVSFKSIEEGISHLKNHLAKSPTSSVLTPSSFLIVVDDIDHVEQLNALRVMGILDRFCNSLVIVTTRDVGVLITAGITIGYNLKGLDRDYGRELFCWHAFGQPHPDSGYEELVNSFVELCGGLPLSLQVLGRHVHGRTKDYWSLELIKVTQMLPQDIKQRLKISFDALDAEEKQVFMDIACFFIGKLKSIAEMVWRGSGWNTQHALGTLKDKCLVQEIRIRDRDWNGKEAVGLRMHDHLRDLGREVALELSPPHRLWRPQDLRSLKLKGFKTIVAEANVRCFHSIFHESMGCQVTYFLGQSDNCFEKSGSLLWLQLGNEKFKSKRQPSIPSWIPLQNLQCLIIKGGQLERLWKHSIQAPSELKELQIYNTFLEEFPDLEKAAMSGLEKLVISWERFVSKILISGIACPSLMSIKLHGMGNLKEVNLTRVKTLKFLDIADCKKLKRLTGTSDLTNLVLLNITECPDLKLEDLRLRGMNCLESIKIDRGVKVKYFELDGCQILKTLEFGCKEIVELIIRGCPKLRELPFFVSRSCLERIIIDGCEISDLQLNGCRNLRSVSGNFGLTGLYINGCSELEELPSLARLSCLEYIVIDSCEKLKNISGIEELHVSRYMNLSYCSNAVIRNCIHKLKSVPSEDGAESTLNEHLFFDADGSADGSADALIFSESFRISPLFSRGIRMIGRAVDGAESTLNESLFFDAHIDADAVTEISSLFSDSSTSAENVGWFEKSGVLSAVIVCFVVVVNSSTFVEDINQSLSPYSGPSFGLNVRQGEWIITMLACGDWIDWLYYFVKKFEQVLMKKGFWVEVKKGEEWKSVGVLQTIVDKLHHL